MPHGERSRGSVEGMAAAPVAVAVMEFSATVPGLPGPGKGPAGWAANAPALGESGAVSCAGEGVETARQAALSMSIDKAKRNGR